MTWCGAGTSGAPQAVASWGVGGVLEGFLVIGIVVAVGYGVGRAGVLGPDATRVLSRTAFFVATPALLFTTLARTDIGAVFSSNLLVTAVTSSLACLLYVPVGLLRRRPAGEVAVGAMASGYVNAGNLGLPIAVYVIGTRPPSRRSCCSSSPC